jgi:F1F0 ATPase subunit 2
MTDGTGYMVYLPIAFAGALLGAVFFGGLWWTTRKAALSVQPAAWVGGSLLLRMAIVLPGFYWIGDGRWDRLLACLLGFVVARFVISRRITRSPHAP